MIHVAVRRIALGVGAVLAAMAALFGYLLA
ncbi:hypothetical protein BH23BAC4_BH23BAC4_13810 [soil metagenome]